MSGQAAPPRLRTRGDALARKLDSAARGQEAAQPGASGRVFRRLRKPPAPRTWRVLALWASLAMAAILLLPRHRVLPYEVRQSVGKVMGALAAGAVLRTGPDGAAIVERGALRLALGPASALRLEGGVLWLEQGSAAVWVAGPFSMRVGAVRIETATALFVGRVQERRVRVYARRGTVRVDGEPVAEGDHWPAEAPPADALASALAELARDPSRGVSSLAQLESQPPPTPADPASRARDEERAGRFAQAAALYAELSRGEGPWAGNALYELGRLRLRKLDQPAQAVQALDEYRRRFPDGPLALEAALTAIEAKLALGQDEPALREMDSFLRQFGASERASEVRWLRASLRLREGRCVAAEPDVRALASDPQRADDALFGLAACGQDQGQGASILRDYLERFPRGRHRREALDRAGH